jgi:dGTPase
LEGLQDDKDEQTRIKDTFLKIKDDNDSVAYLRAKAINLLTQKAAEVFKSNESLILNGTFNSTLLKKIEDNCHALKEVMDLSINKIYNHHSVIEIEITGFHVMSHLLRLFVPAVLREKKKGTDQMALNLIPFQFTEYETTSQPYLKVMSIVDYISGMTDAYATEFYRKTTGIDISKHV